MKSSFTETGNCVEVARPDGAVLVRDSNRPQGARVSFQPSAWYTLVDWIKQ